jgi:hypothetical protein
MEKDAISPRHQHRGADHMLLRHHLFHDGIEVRGRA